MKKTRMAVVVCATALALVLGYGLMAYPAGNDRFTARGAFATDTVDIVLSDQIDVSEERLLVDDSSIMHVATIENAGARCWIRMQTRLSSPSYGAALLSNEEQREGWVTGQDGWTYRATPLEEGKSCDVAESIAVPEGWRDGTASTMVSELVVEAVQADGFLPDMKSEDPWGGVEVSACVHQRVGETS